MQAQGTLTYGLNTNVTPSTRSHRNGSRSSNVACLLTPTKEIKEIKTNREERINYAELANKFKSKREQLANERNDGAKKEQALTPHKRTNSEDFIPQQGKSKLLGHKSVIQSSSREELRTSHMIAGKGQTKQRLFQSVHMTGTTLGNVVVQHDIEDLLNFKQVKRKSVRPATSIAQFLDKQQIHNEHDIYDIPNFKQRAAKDNNEEPSKPEMFIATRTKVGKDIKADAQAAIAECPNCQNSGEKTDDAFREVFGKEQPGRLRCYGRLVTTSSLKKDEEINNLKQKHANEITSLKE
ncbi:hypothetical protein RDI58_000924 [Solanum bulbocastanum]|uniref:Uncharacterized protein n=1 Tax=Solanum bulbocastanum TaxID=147425 RepID=A0AAN8UBK7_SOLBU